MQLVVIGCSKVKFIKVILLRDITIVLLTFCCVLCYNSDDESNN